MKDLTKGNLSAIFLKFAIPAILAGMLSQAYALIDSVIIGKFLGTESLAALGATSGLISLVDSLFWGYGVGCGIYVAKLFSSGEKLQLRNTIIATLLTESLVAVVISALLVLLQQPLLDVLRVDPKIRSEASQYFCIVVSSLAIQNFTWLGVYLTNALGISTFPLYMSIIMCVINIGGNLLSVLVLDAGVVGVALSTLLAAVAVAVCYVVKFLHIFRELGAVGRFSMVGYFKGAIPYAVPSMFQQCLIYISNASVSPLINAEGFAATAAYSVAHKYYNLCASLYQNSTKVMANFTSQCTGNGEYRRIREGLWITLRQSTLIVLPLLLACIIVPETMCGFFFNAETPAESYALAIPFLRFFMPLILFNLINNLFHSLVKGIKATKLLLLSSFIGCATYVIVSYSLSGSLGLYGVYTGWAVSWIAEAVFAIIVYFSGKWQPKEMRMALQTK